MTAQTMPNWLMKRAKLTPERIAIVHGNESWTFSELDQRARRKAKRLLQQGVREGDRVALLMQNGGHAVAMIHALHYIGAVLIPLNTRLAVAELRLQLDDSEPCLLVFDHSQTASARALARALPELPLLAWEDLTLGAAEKTCASLKSSLSLGDLQAIMYTSGTTGRPKGVMLTYGNHWWSAVGSALNLGLHTNDRWLMSVPLFHMSGLSILMRSVIYGITAVIHETFDPTAVNRAIAEEGVTIVSVVSTMLNQMVNQLGASVYPDSLRCLLLGGGPAPKPLLEKCHRKGIPVFQTYGLTETASQIATLSAEYMLRKSGSAGQPLFPSKLRIEENGREQPPGKAGEIVVKGPNVTPGYWRRERETATAIRDGWLYTGDIGYVDEEGFLYVLDRRSDLIISGGENVYPAEIEAVLMSHPAVREAGVSGIDDPDWGQVPVAFVVLNDGAGTNEKELQSLCRERLAGYKQPKRIYFVEALPRTGANKLLRRELLNLIT